MTRPIAIETGEGLKPLVQKAVEEAGGKVSPFESAEGLIFVNPRNPGRLSEILKISPNLEWIQLPYAGIEPYIEILDKKYLWTCGKGIYARPVAEMALTLMLVGLRSLNTYALAKSWQKPVGVNLIGAKVLILGGGGISEELIKLLDPFDCQITVVRKRQMPLDQSIKTAVEIKTPDALPELYGKADVVVLALALTPETTNIIDKTALDLMANHAWIINVGRGQHIDTDALVAALKSKSIGGAGLDVTEPEPLPDGHPLWELENCVITPHTANTPEMGVPLLVNRIQKNVELFCKGQELLGPIDVDLKY